MPILALFARVGSRTVRKFQFTVSESGRVWVTWPAVAVIVSVEVPAGVPDADGVVPGLVPVEVEAGAVPPQLASDTIISRQAKAKAVRDRALLLVTKGSPTSKRIAIGLHGMRFHVPNKVSEEDGLAVVVRLTAMALVVLPLTVTDAGDTEHVAAAGTTEQASVTVPVRLLGASCRL